MIGNAGSAANDLNNVMKNIFDPADIGKIIVNPDPKCTLSSYAACNLHFSNKILINTIGKTFLQP